MAKKLVIVALLIGVIALPLLLRHEATHCANGLDHIVVLSPHTEAVCDEFDIGFKKWYAARTGRSIAIDWRHPGGLTESVRMVQALYENGFKIYWENTLKRAWSPTVAKSFLDVNIELPKNPAEDSLAQSARRAFLESNISCGIDVFFGGGVHEFNRLMGQGFFMTTEIAARNPEWFEDNAFPLALCGDALRDKSGAWFGTVFTTFGIAYNRDVLNAIGVKEVPQYWSQIASGRFYGEVALCDPSKSGTARKAFELMIQEAMYRKKLALLQSGLSASEANHQAQIEGWISGLKLIQKICANARYFTDKSTKPTLDVSAGDCAVGSTIDYYGLSQAQSVLERSGSNRFGYLTPVIGGASEADPIAVLRGAHSPAIALAFLEYILSEQGQKLWAFQAGAPGGPQKHTLRRTPIRRELYTNPNYQAYRSDPDIDPYTPLSDFVYQPEWTSPIFSVLNLIIQATCMGPHPELQNAWGAILRAEQEGRMQDANKALAIMENFEGLEFNEVAGPIKKVCQSSQPLAALQLETDLTKRFIHQYKLAEKVANGEPRN